MTLCARIKNKRFSHILAISIFLLSACAVNISAANPKKLFFKWNFRKSDDLVYSIHQSMEGQRNCFDFTSKQWVRTRNQKEEVSGYCVFLPAGDNNASVSLFLKIEKVLQNNTPQPLPDQPDTGVPAARVVIRPDGSFEAVSQAQQQQTYLILRLIFGLPDQGLVEHEGKVSSFRKLTAREPISNLANGTIDYEFQGFETVGGTRCAKLLCKINLTTDMDSQKLPGSVDWKGIGTMYFDVEAGRMIKSHWRIGEKIETNVGNDKVPAKAVEILTIDTALKATRPDSGGQMKGGY